MVAAQAGAYFNDTSAGSFFTEILREDYQPGVIETLNNSNFLYNYLPRAQLQFQGKHWVFALHTGRSAGHSAIGPGGRIPDPDKQRYSRWRGPVRHHFGRIQLDAALEVSTGDRASFIASVMDSEIRGITEDMARQKNRMVHLDGSGRLAQVNGNVVASATVVVELPQVPESPTTMTGLNATHWLHEGMRIAFVDPAGPTIVDVALISSVDSATQITMDQVVTVDDGDWLVTNATADGTDRVSTGFKREPMGFAGIFSDTNPLCYDTIDDYESGTFATDSFQNVDADDTANDFARAIIMDNGGVKRPPTEMLLIRAMTAATRKNNAMPSFLLSAPEVQDAFGELLLADRRFMNTTTLSGGWTALDFRGKPWVTDRDCLPNRIYVPDMGYVLMGSLEEYHWEQRTGMLQQLQDHDEYHARIKGRWNMVCTLRNKQLLITDLDDTL